MNSQEAQEDEDVLTGDSDLSSNTTHMRDKKIKANIATNLIRVGAGVLLLQNLWLLFTFFQGPEEPEVSSSIVSKLDLLWNIGFKMDLLAFTLLAIGLYMLSNKVKTGSHQNSAYLFGFWIILSIFWRMIIVGNPFAENFNPLELSGVTLLVNIYIICTLILVGASIYLRMGKVPGSTIFLIFTIFNLLGGLNIWFVFNSLREYSSFSELQEALTFAIFIKALLVPILATIASILMIIKKIDLTQFRPSTNYEMEDAEKLSTRQKLEREQSFKDDPSQYNI